MLNTRSQEQREQQEEVELGERKRKDLNTRRRIFRSAGADIASRDERRTVAKQLLKVQMFGVTSYRQTRSASYCASARLVQERSVNDDLTK